MSHSDKLFFNSIFLKNRIAELGLRQWWLSKYDVYVEGEIKNAK